VPYSRRFIGAAVDLLKRECCFQIMRNTFFVLIIYFTVGSLFAQQGDRLIELPAKKTPSTGQSLYVFTVKMRSRKSVVLSIDDVRTAHLFNKESAEIAVPIGNVTAVYYSGQKNT
jgi:biopolymer transport protein ExbD